MYAQIPAYTHVCRDQGEKIKLKDKMTNAKEKLQTHKKVWQSMNESSLNY